MPPAAWRALIQCACQGGDGCEAAVIALIHGAHFDLVHPQHMNVYYPPDEPGVWRFEGDQWAWDAREDFTPDLIDAQVRRLLSAAREQGVDSPQVRQLQALAAVDFAEERQLCQRVNEICERCSRLVHARHRAVLERLT